MSSGIPDDMSEHYFTLSDGIVDVAALEECSGDAFRLYINLFAYMNRAKNRTGKITLSARQLRAAACRSQTRTALKYLQELSDYFLITFELPPKHLPNTSELPPEHFRITVCKYAKVRVISNHKEKKPIREEKKPNNGKSSKKRDSKSSSKTDAQSALPLSTVLLSKPDCTLRDSAKNPSVPPDWTTDPAFPGKILAVYETMGGCHFEGFEPFTVKDVEYCYGRYPGKKRKPLAFVKWHAMKALGLDLWYREKNGKPPDRPRMSARNWFDRASSKDGKFDSSGPRILQEVDDACDKYNAALKQVELEKNTKIMIARDKEAQKQNEKEAKENISVPASVFVAMGGES